MNCIMPFVDESKSHTHGFENGVIWMRMRYAEGFESYLFHTVNIEQVRMMCELFGYDYLIDKIDDTWSCLTANTLTKNN